MLAILFGLSGSGKNFVGNILAKHFGYHFWDADSVLLPEMRQCIEKRELFTQKMRDDFMRVIIAKVTELKKTYPKLAIAQALYKEKNRVQLLDALPDSKLLYIEADPAKIAERLAQGVNKLVDADYARKISQNFEPSRLPHITITNNTDENSIIAQLQTKL